MNAWYRVYRTSAHGAFIAVPEDYPRHRNWRGGRRYRRKDVPQHVQIIGEKP